MVFGSTPREFDSTGLPKYGAELSDDDEYTNSYVEADHSYVEDISTAVSRSTGSEQPRWQVRGNSNKASSNLSKDTVAYDSELDHSD